VSAQPADSADLKLYGNAATAALLWHFRLHPRPISSRSEGMPNPAEGEIPFGAMVSYRATSLPDGTPMEVADRFWSANLYKAEAAALLAITPREVERRLLSASSGSASRPTELSSHARGTLARAAEALGVPDRNAWFQEVKNRVESLLSVPQVWSGIEAVVAAVRERGALSDHDVEDLLDRKGVPRAPWPDWMPGKEPASDFYFD